jgi:hypothetical protein
MRDETRPGRRLLRSPSTKARAKFVTLFDSILSLGESYEELLWLRKRVAALSRKRKKTKPNARKRLRPKTRRSPSRPRR